MIEVIDRNSKHIIDSLTELGTENLCISSISFSEILLGATNKLHYAKLLREITKFLLIPVNQEIDEVHRSLVKKYALSHRLAIQDAIIAGTALYYDLPIYTLNKKDFQFIDGLKVIA